jgi:ParB-like chromosome segregation protein Spo0J
MTEEIKFHPLADMFPLMEGEEFGALVADIEANKLRIKITLYEGTILDGRNRYRALRALRASPRQIRDHCCVTMDCINKAHGGPAAYVISANLHRRHLTADEKRDVIAELIKAAPEKSDRQIAKQAKASPTTVGTTRAKMEKTGEVSNLDTRTDAKGARRARCGACSSRCFPNIR